MEKLEHVINNDCFDCILHNHSLNAKIYIFKFKQSAQCDEIQVLNYLDAFCKSLKMISQSQINTVIVLDCSLVTNIAFAKQFFKVGIKELKELERGHIERLIIVSFSKLIVAAGTAIIHLKQAHSYTKIVSSIEEVYTSLLIKTNK